MNVHENHCMPPSRAWQRVAGRKLHGVNGRTSKFETLEGLRAQVTQDRREISRDTSLCTR